MVIVGDEFPAIDGIPKNKRIRLPGSNSPSYGMIHDGIIQSIIQSCFFAERKFSKSKPVDQHRLPELALGQMQRLTGRIFRRWAKFLQADWMPWTIGQVRSSFGSTVAAFGFSHRRGQQSRAIDGLRRGRRRIIREQPVPVCVR